MSETVTQATCYYTSERLLNLLSNLYVNDYKIAIQQPHISNESTEDEIKEKLQSLVKEFTELLDIIEEKKLNNEQWCLDGMDEMNKQSVRF